ncbi:EamA family transporter [Leifsonia sp. NPDC102414]|uniref:EamA family transporter n=1 Tax=Leifsonia sp. NPDC102414 TaxID=3364124 RepID=UPI0037FC6EBE
MLTAVLGLVGAFVYGSADFLGGIAARKISAIKVTAIGALSGLVLLFVALPFAGGEWSASAIGWGALSGVTGAVAISLLYACLAIGPMSILSPLTAVVSAVVPMTWGLIGGEQFAPIGYVALGLALVAVVFVGFVPEKGAVRPSLRGILMAVGSGAMIGAFLIIIDQTPDSSGLVPLVLNRAVNGVIMLAVVGVLALRSRRVHQTQPSASAWLPGLPFAIACGVLDAAANIVMLFGLRLGDLAAFSVLIALYPAGTIVLAAIVLRERIAPIQWVGLALAVAAAGMLAIA